MKGITFLEVLIIVGIIAVLFVLTIPVGLRFYKSEYLYNVTEGVIQALRRARFQALSQSENNYGVFLGSGKSGRYILFRGASYADRDDEEIFEVPEDIYFSGISEVIFSKLNGLPSATGNIFITDGFATHTVNINQEGRITYIPSIGGGGCWGTGGSCDPECLYSSYGTLTDYYTNPGCSDSCDPAGSFYVNPSGSCSSDGSGICYKMENPTTQYTSCVREDGCEQGCIGEPISCDNYDNQRDCEYNGCTWEEKGECYGTCDCRRYPSDYCETCPLCRSAGERCIGTCQCSSLRDSSSCRSCPRCSWFSTGTGKCVGTPTSCEDISDPSFCRRHGCSWDDVKWYWSQLNSREGYLMFSQCQWYAQ